MAATSVWMPLYIGDYLADTMRLEGPEHGAYLLLIMEYWRNGPLPDDDRALAAIARTQRKDWAAMSTLVRGYFRRGDDGKLHHKRIDQELSAAAQHVEQRRAAGRASAAKRAFQRDADDDLTDEGTGVNEKPTAAEKPWARNPNPSPSPSSSPSSGKEESRAITGNIRSKPAAPRHVNDDPGHDFDVFWRAYPRKVGKGQARKAFKIAIEKTTLEAILAAIAQQQWGEERYRPHPTTWLNGERWLDETDMFDPVLRAAGLTPEDMHANDFEGSDGGPLPNNGGLLN